MRITSFRDLDLDEPIQRALAAVNYSTPTPIQAATIPHLLAGRDLMGCAQTGTGKTAAFALPILQCLDDERRPAARKAPRALVLSPTRELAAQIAESFADYGRHLRLRHTVIFGGVGQGSQVRALSEGVHILVATPGRLLDLMGQGHLRLDQVDMFVLDEADRMLDMGFMPDVRRVIAALPKDRQSICFSATMPPDVAKLAASLLIDPIKVAVTPPSSTVDRIEQRVLFASQSDKRALLRELLEDDRFSQTLVFTRTKRRADVVARQLRAAGVSADAIHGNKSQNARERALHGFRTGRVRVLVATDIAARGLDVEGISHVINYDLPNEPESYVHRIGRTGRAGAAGEAISLCDPTEADSLRAIEKVIGKSIRVDRDHAFDVSPRSAPVKPSAGRSPARGEAPSRRRRRPRSRSRVGR